MRLSAQKIKAACRRMGLPLTEALREAGVSRTAYYSLLRNDSVLPASLLFLADRLGVPPSQLLDDGIGPEAHLRLMLRRLERILDAHPEANRENVWHTLLLLDEPPIERLERGLSRGRALDLH